MGGTWRLTSLFLSRFAAESISRIQPNFVYRRFITNPLIIPNQSPNYLIPLIKVCNFRPFSSYPSAASPIFDLVANNNYDFDDEHNKYTEEMFLHHDENDEVGKISVKAIFLCTRYTYIFIMTIGYHAPKLFDEMPK